MDLHSFLCLWIPAGSMVPVSSQIWLSGKTDRKTLWKKTVCLPGRGTSCFLLWSISHRAQARKSLRCSWVSWVELVKHFSDENFSHLEDTSAMGSSIFISVKPIYWWHHKSQPKVQAGKQNKKSQQGFILTDLYIIYVYTTKLTYNVISLEELFVHSSACSVIWFLSDYKIWSFLQQPQTLHRLSL